MDNQKSSGNINISTKSDNIPFNFDINEKDEDDSSEDNPEEIEEHYVSRLEERKNLNNSLFGFIPWKSSVAHRPLESRSEVVRNLYQESTKLTDKDPSSFHLMNFVWVLLFGWWMSILYLAAALILALTIIGLPYAKLLLKLSTFILWPFEKFLVRGKSNEMKPLLGSNLQEEKKPSFSMGPYVVYCVVSGLLLVIPHLLSTAFCWFFVGTIPMAKFNKNMLKFLFIKEPLTLDVSKEYPGAGSELLMVTYKASSANFFKYSVGGMNVVLVNLLPFVFVTLILCYIVPHAHRPPDVALFVIALVSTIPLTYYLGTALASLSAQTNVAVGAVLTAGFGSIIELILYGSAILKGGLERIVQAAIIGSLLADLLLLPGLSMIFGGLKYKEQRFNPVTAGVSSVLLITSIIGAFTPTIFHQTYGHYGLDCGSCIGGLNGTSLMCGLCTTTSINYDLDPVYTSRTRPLMYICAAILPFAYIIGLIFTLKTHAHIYELKFDTKFDAKTGKKSNQDSNKDEEEHEGHGGHDAPEWGVPLCLTILITATALFALIAEAITEVIQSATESIGLSQTFTGVTFLAIIPSTSEFVNAVLFALKNNIQLSVEIGYSVTCQITLIQIPVVVAFSAIINHAKSEHSFVMIFPTLEVFLVIFAVIILNYLSMDGRANYFHGSVLFIVYLLIIITFFFVPDAANTFTPTNRIINGYIASGFK